MRSIDRLLIIPDPKHAEHIMIDSRLCCLRLNEMVNFSQVSRTYEIFSGEIYLNQPTGWNASKRTFAKVEARFYSPYKELGISIEPIMLSAWRSKIMLTTVDYEPTNAPLLWVKTQICKFFCDCLAADDVKIDDSQRELPF